MPRRGLRKRVTGRYLQSNGAILRNQADFVFHTDVGAKRFAVMACDRAVLNAPTSASSARPVTSLADELSPVVTPSHWRTEYAAWRRRSENSRSCWTRKTRRSTCYPACIRNRRSRFNCLRRDDHRPLLATPLRLLQGGRHLQEQNRSSAVFPASLPAFNHATPDGSQPVHRTLTPSLASSSIRRELGPNADARHDTLLLIVQRTYDRSSITSSLPCTRREWLLAAVRCVGLRTGHAKPFDKSRRPPAAPRRDPRNLPCIWLAAGAAAWVEPKNRSCYCCRPSPPTRNTTLSSAIRHPGQVCLRLANMLMMTYGREQDRVMAPLVVPVRDREAVAAWSRSSLAAQRTVHVQYTGHLTLRSAVIVTSQIEPRNIHSRSGCHASGWIPSCANE
nr:hypothetical protein CFP56_32377 [Quercus suber]